GGGRSRLPVQVLPDEGMPGAARLRQHGEGGAFRMHGTKHFVARIDGNDVLERLPRAVCHAAQLDQQFAIELFDARNETCGGTPDGSTVETGIAFERAHVKVSTATPTCSRACLPC